MSWPIAIAYLGTYTVGRYHYKRMKRGSVAGNETEVAAKKPRLSKSARRAQAAEQRKQLRDRAGGASAAEPAVPAAPPSAAVDAQPSADGTSALAPAAFALADPMEELRALKKQRKKLRKKLRGGTYGGAVSVDDIMQAYGADGADRDGAPAATGAAAAAGVAGAAAVTAAAGAAAGPHRHPSRSRSNRAKGRARKGKTAAASFGGIRRRR